MILATRSWGGVDRDRVVCIHGIGQYGGIFRGLAERLVAGGHAVTTLDLRGHGESGREPPWTVGRHVDDVLETLDVLGIERATWIGHSFGGRVAAALAVATGERTRGLALLDASLHVPPDQALQGAEMDRLDWSFETRSGAVNALLAGRNVVAAPREAIEHYVEEDVTRGADGRYRFRFCPGAAVTAWSEMALPPPEIAKVPTLIVSAMSSSVGRDVADRCRRALGELASVVSVPNGHNVLWESPMETIAAVAAFLDDHLPSPQARDGGGGTVRSSTVLPTSGGSRR